MREQKNKKIIGATLPKEQRRRKGTNGAPRDQQKKGESKITGKT